MASAPQCGPVQILLVTPRVWQVYTVPITTTTAATTYRDTFLCSSYSSRWVECQSRKRNHEIPLLLCKRICEPFGYTVVSTPTSLLLLLLIRLDKHIVTYLRKSRLSRRCRSFIFRDIQRRTFELEEEPTNSFLAEIVGLARCICGFKWNQDGQDNNEPSYSYSRSLPGSKRHSRFFIFSLYSAAN